MMAPYLADFFGGAFLCNAVPHFVSGVMGRPFRTPFGAMSSPVTNVLWACCNLAAAYALLYPVGGFDLHALDNVVAAGSGVALMGLASARIFERQPGAGRGAGTRVDRSG